MLNLIDMVRPVQVQGLPQKQSPLDCLPLKEQRKLLFTRCESKEHLRNWIRMFLSQENSKLEFPDSHIEPTSNSTVMDMLWEFYEAGVNNHLFKTENGAPASRMLVYASRDSYKTLGAAVLELLGMLHMHRSCVHLAAIKDQSSQAQRYLRKFLSKPLLSPFIYGDNVTMIQVKWYVDPNTNDIISLNELKNLPLNERSNYTVFHDYYSIICTATLNGVNSQHTPLMIIDELDLCQANIVSEASMIPSCGVDEDGTRQPALTLLTSTRKFSTGMVMDTIANAENTGTVIRHWNWLDVSKKCPEYLCQTQKGYRDLWVDDVSYEAYKSKEYLELRAKQPKIANRCNQISVPVGCLDCKIMKYCRGLLSNVTDNASCLNDVEYSTIPKIVNQGDHNKVVTQLLCRRPGNEGSVYPMYNPDIHLISGNEIWVKVKGEEVSKTIDQDDLINLFRLIGARFAIGIDFGFNHPFAVVFSAMWQKVCYVLDYTEVQHLSEAEQVAFLKRRYQYLNPVLWPDTAAAGAMASLRKAGFQVKSHTKNILGGIESVRAALKPVGSESPNLFLLSNENPSLGCMLLSRRIQSYNMKRDGAGNPIDEPLDQDDDGCDALRYLVSNELSRKNVFEKKNEEPRVEDPVRDIIESIRNEVLTTAQEHQEFPMKFSRGRISVDFT
jgi:hypothetical protein